MTNIRDESIKHINSFIFRVPVLESRVPYILRVLIPTFMVEGHDSDPRDWYRVPSLESQL